MPGVHSTAVSSEMIQLSRLSPEIPRLDILEHEADESQMGNNLFDMFSSQFSASSANNSNNMNSNSNSNNNTSSSSDKPAFPEISVFPTPAIQGGSGQAAAAGRDGSFDSFQFLRHSMFGDREKELEDTRELQASPSSVVLEAPITKLWTGEYEEPHYSDGGVSCEQHQHGSFDSLDANTSNSNRNGLAASFKANSSWGVSTRSSTVLEPTTTTTAATANAKPKRKRSRPCKSNEEVESQRMTHIAVERNRRKQMNEHLRVLRGLMPGSYVQRGDQASIIGGAIEFVKELQHILHCLEDQKKRKMSLVESPARLLASPAVIQGGFPFNTAVAGVAAARGPPPPADVKYFDAALYEPVRVLYGEANSDLANVEVKIDGLAADIRILSQKKPGQLLRTMTALESKLLLTIVHINVTTIELTVLYAFKVKIGPGCGSAEELAAFIHDTLASSSLEDLQLQQ